MSVFFGVAGLVFGVGREALHTPRPAETPTRAPSAHPKEPDRGLDAIYSKGRR